MSARKLPKAITRTSEEMREIAGGSRAEEPPKRPTRRKVASHASDEEAPMPPSAAPRAAVEAKPAPAPEPDPVLELSAPPLVGEVLPPPAPPPEPEAAKFRPQARRIVERHAVYAAVGGLIPLPVATVAGITAVIVRMVKELSNLYEVPFERDRTRSIVMGLMGGAVPTGLGVAAASTLALVAPGGGLVVGLFVSSITAAASTRGIGLAFAAHFESGATSLDIIMPERA